MCSHVAAQCHRLRGLVSAARGDDPAFAGTEIRIGIEAFSARGYRAQAQEELGRWLVDQQRPDDAAPLLEAARATYAADRSRRLARIARRLGLESAEHPGPLTRFPVIAPPSRTDLWMAGTSSGTTDLSCAA